MKLRKPKESEEERHLQYRAEVNEAHARISELEGELEAERSKAPPPVPPGEAWEVVSGHLAADKQGPDPVSYLAAKAASAIETWLKARESDQAKERNPS